MRVVAAQVVDVQRDLSVVGEALEELLHQVDVELADQRAGELDVVLEPRPSGKIDHHARQRLVQGHVGVAEAAHAGLVADRPGERLPQRDADVLDRVMRVDVQIALRLDVEVEHGVARHLLEHVLEKGQPGRELRLALAVDVEPHPNPGFPGVADDFGGTHVKALPGGR